MLSGFRNIDIGFGCIFNGIGYINIYLDELLIKGMKYIILDKNILLEHPEIINNITVPIYIYTLYSSATEVSLECRKKEVKRSGLIQGHNTDIVLLERYPHINIITDNIEKILKKN